MKAFAGAALAAMAGAAVVLGLLLTGVASPVSAAELYSEDAVKAAFLYRFTGYVEWPQQALQSPQFTIAVLGADDVARQLELLLPNYSVKGRPAQVRRIKNLRELGNAQMLYIGRNHEADLGRLIARVAAHPLLIVTDDRGGLAVGSTVNFLLVDRRVRFEISVPAAERSGLKISSELLSVAARVQGGRL